MPKKKRPVVVTTEFRGVFFGYMEKEENTTVTLSGCRNCISWTSEVRGFAGLAITGPLDGCRIGPAASKMKLHKVTAILDCTKEAEEASFQEFGQSCQKIPKIQRISFFLPLSEIYQRGE